MNHDELNTYIKRELDYAYSLMSKKNDEYSTMADPLHNFNCAAKLQGITPIEALGGFLAKHIISVYDLINDPGKHDDYYTWHEKITDSIVYLSILHAMVESQCYATAKEETHDESASE